MERLGLGDVVRLPGARPHDEVLRRMSRAAVLALPCRVAADGDRDSMPLVVKEAMARAVPVVVSDEVGLPEVVDDEVGRLVAPEDPAGAGRGAGGGGWTTRRWPSGWGGPGASGCGNGFRLADEVEVLRGGAPGGLWLPGGPSRRRGSS